MSYNYKCTYKYTIQMNGDGIMENTNLKDTQTGIPLIGDNAPAFRAMTTMGKINFPEDYKGSWVILFSSGGFYTGMYN